MRQYVQGESAQTAKGTVVMGVNPSNAAQQMTTDGSGNVNVNLAAGSVTVAPVVSNTSSAVAQTSVGTSAGSILAANAARKRLSVQNTGTTIIYLAFAGKVPTNTAYHVALPACGVANDGSSPVYIDTMETGAVQAISSASGGLCVVEERT